MFEKNKKKLAQFLESEFHDSNIEFIHEGYSSIVFQVNDSIIRFPKDNLSDYKKEHFIYLSMREKTYIKTPDSKIIHSQYNYVKHQKIMGATWNNDSIINLFQNQQKQLVQDISAFLNLTHKETHNFLSPAPSFAAAPEMYCFLKKRLSESELNYIMPIYENTNIFVQKPKVFIHGDFHSQNCTLDEKSRLYGVFDWCNSGIGEKERDFVNLFIDMNKHFVDQIICEYEKVSKTTISIDRLKQLSLVKILNTMFWSASEAYKDNKHNEIENDMLIKLKKIFL